jgi:hypothetical protein
MSKRLHWRNTTKTMESQLITKQYLARDGKDDRDFYRMCHDDDDDV